MPSNKAFNVLENLKAGLHTSQDLVHFRGSGIVCFLMYEYVNERVATGFDKVGPNVLMSELPASHNIILSFLDFAFINMRGTLTLY
jgi:hypothetical protein